MTTDISISSSSLYNFETDSSSSYVSSSHTDRSYALQPRQTRNLESLMDILDSRENFKELMSLLDGRMAFQKMLTIDHIHSTIRRMEHEIRKQKARATMLFDDVLHAKKSRRLRMHFKRNHSSRTQQELPEPLPILPPFQSPSPPPPPVPVPGTPENPINVDKGRQTPLLKYWMARNYLPGKKAMKNSPSGAGRTPRLSMTGRGGSIGTWRDDARTVARSATVRDGVERV